jgi:hypothetical protein
MVWSPSEEDEETQRVVFEVQFILERLLQGVCNFEIIINKNVVCTLKCEIVKFFNVINFPVISFLYPN